MIVTTFFRWMVRGLADGRFMRDSARIRGFYVTAVPMLGRYGMYTVWGDHCLIGANWGDYYAHGDVRWHITTAAERNAWCNAPPDARGGAFLIGTSGVGLVSFLFRLAAEDLDNAHG